jgi:hypothetical protein
MPTRPCDAASSSRTGAPNVTASFENAANA